MAMTMPHSSHVDSDCQTTIGVTDTRTPQALVVSLPNASSVSICLTHGTLLIPGIRRSRWLLAVLAF